MLDHKSVLLLEAEARTTHLIPTFIIELEYDGHITYFDAFKLYQKWRSLVVYLGTAVHEKTVLGFGKAQSQAK